jgi:tetratricopeptide (TPR) repeat protein
LYQIVKQKKIPFYTILGVIILLYAFKTIDRNKVWKDDFTLFTTDVKISNQSAKILNAAGGALSTAAYKLDDGPKKTEMLQQATFHLKKAIQIHPNYKNAHLILGNAYYFLGKQDSAILSYENVLKIDPSDAEGSKNLAIILRDMGRVAGEKENNLPKSIELLTRSEQLYPNDSETLRYLGVAYGISNQHEKAIQYFKKVIELVPNDVNTMINLSSAYRLISNNSEAQFWTNKALSIDPNILNPKN